MQGAVLDQLEAAAAALAGLDPHELADAAKLEWTARVLKVERLLDGFIAGQLHTIDTGDVTTVEHGCTTRSWLVEHQQLSRADATARLRVARSAVARPAIVEQLREGAISHDHAALIVNYLPTLPDVQTRDVAEKELLRAAEFTDPPTIRRELRELTDRLCLNETAEERAVRLREGRYLRFIDTIDEMVVVDGMLDRVGATILRKALYPLAVKAGELDGRTPPQRTADALVELGSMAMDSGQLPDSAEEPTHVTVLTPLSDLRRELEAGEVCTSTLDGTPITPNTARMLACDASIIPAVLGGPSEILDLGRSTRTWTRAQRKAAKIRADGHCEAPRCRADIERCDLHHQHYWEHGGPSDINNAIYLCAYHHWLEHHTNWHFTRNKDGTVSIRKT